MIKNLSSVVLLLFILVFLPEICNSETDNFEDDWYKDRNYNRLFIAPTGRALDGGDGYIIDYYLFFPGFAYGLTDRITIAGGMSLFPGVNLKDQLIYFNPKISFIRNERYSFALATFIFRFPDEDQEFGLLFGMNSFEFKNLQITAGLGFGFVDDEFSETPAVIGGFIWRYAKDVAFVTENWFVPDEDKAPLISYGLRFMGEKIAVDLGFFNRTNEDFKLPGVIYGNFAFHF